MEKLFRELRAFQEADQGLSVICHPEEGIEHRHVVQVVNECLRAGLTRIAFSGTALDE